MWKSGAKVSGKNKLPHSQLNGFIKRHRVPPMAALSNTKTFSKSEILPNIPTSSLSSQETQPNSTPSDTTTNNNNSKDTLHFTNTSPPVRKQQAVMGMARMSPVKMMSVETRDSMRVMQTATMEVERAKEAMLEVETTHMIVSSPKEMQSVAAEEVVQLEGTAAAAVDHDTTSEMSSPTKMTEESISIPDSMSPTKPKLKKTPEQLQEKADGKVQKSLHLFTKTASMPVKSPDGTLYEKEFLSHLKSIRITYFLLRQMPLGIVRSSRLKIAKGMVDTGIVKFLADIVTEVFSSGTITSGDAEVAKNHRRVVISILSTLVNYSDCSDDVTYALRDHPGILPAILKQLKEWAAPHCARELPKETEVMLKSSLSIMHNVSMREDNYQQVRDMGASIILLPYLESHNDTHKLTAYATLADIVSEEEADKLSTSPHLASFLLKRLENALKSKDHRCYGWSVTELVRAVRRLARNDANKRLLVEQGALSLLSNGTMSAFDDEKCGCMEALWVLSFNQQNVDEILKNDELLDKVISASRDYSLPSSFRHSAAGVLWQCRHGLAKSEKYGEIGKQILRKKKRGKKPPQDLRMPSVDDSSGKDAGKDKEGGKEEEDIGHVMMSYQWADQKVVKQIRDVLRSAGFKVWMDIDDMGGSTLQAMAAAIEDSFAVLICMSQKYKDSPNTRAEAEYTFQQRKKIIPLIMQKGYRPDGWLGIILGAKLFYDFSGKYTFESRIEGLVKAVRVAAGQDEDTDGGIKKPEPLKMTSSVKPEAKPTAATAVTQIGRPAPPPARSLNSERIKAWTDADVKSWLTKFGLNGTQLEKLTGKEIVFLYKLRTEAPAFFYNTLDRKLQITTLLGLISFTEALEDLPSTWIK